MSALRDWLLGGVVGLLLLLAPGRAAAGAVPGDLLPSRLDHPGLRATLLEGLAYLEDNQVRDRPGRGSCLRDSSCEGDGCRGRTSLNLPCWENIGLPGGPVCNRTGEWASHVHFLPKTLGFAGRTIIGKQDSNLFVTAGIAEALLLFDDAGLPGDRRFVSGILELALADIHGLKRNMAYNFWPLLPGVEAPFPRVGPVNIRVERVRRLAAGYARGRFAVLTAVLMRGQRLPPRWWLATVLDRCGNPAGADALFNIPEDADDTALAVAVQRLYACRRPDHAVRPDLPALEQVARYRDLGRCREDGRDAWKGKDTGAFLTWLKDEAEPVFANPCTGVMPLAVNNVDAVVNANVAFALAVNDCKGLPGYADCLRLLARVAEEHLWPEAALYYPQYMIFPYAASRAFRDGGAREGPMRPAMFKLLAQLLDEQEAWGRRHPRHWGAFPGGEDPSDHLATALGLTALLNLGRPMACAIGQAERYDQGVEAAVAYLIRVRRCARLADPCTRARLPGVPQAAVWDSGLFFGAGSDLVHWRSQAFTAAVVLEALAKYAVAYDLDGCALHRHRLALVDLPGGAGRIGFVVVVGRPQG